MGGNSLSEHIFTPETSATTLFLHLSGLACRHGNSQRRLFNGDVGAFISSLVAAARCERWSET
jgi:hypothetical protein